MEIKRIQIRGQTAYAKPRLYTLNFKWLLATSLCLSLSQILGRRNLLTLVKRLPGGSQEARSAARLLSPQEAEGPVFEANIYRVPEMCHALH